MAMCKCAAVFLLLIHSTFGEEPSLRIIGGEVAQIVDFPYQVSIRLRGQHSCGGSILDKETILTAAHCVEDKVTKYSVYVGSNDLEAKTVEHKVKRILVHKEYDDEVTPVNDIALFKISPPITYSASQKPVKLPADGQSTPAGTMAVMTGWGLTKERGSKSRYLRKVYLPILTMDECKKVYGDYLHEHQLCAGYLATGGKDACQGDSGGPLVVEGVQVGIASWGEGCGLPNHPGTYTNVSNYIKWISEKM